MSRIDGRESNQVKSSYQLTKILAATGNAHKLRELQAVGDRFGIQFVSPKEMRESRPELGDVPDPDETGETYRENALIKARAFGTWASMPALGDDSGLEVKILGDAPGIYSARFGGPGLTDIERCKYLLEKVHQKEVELGSKDRLARYRSYLVLWYPDAEPLEAEGTLEGEVIDDFKGERGFGYDPIIYHESLGATLAEVDFSVTCSEGFRAKALEILLTKLINLP